MIRGVRLLAALLLAGAACGPPSGRPIAYGQDACDHCHMTVVDPRFAGELVTAKGRIYTFDDVQCLAQFIRGATVPADQVALALVNDFHDPGRMIGVREAVFLRSDSLRSPMGSGLAALPPGRVADSVRQALGGDLLTWEQVMALPGHEAHRPAGAGSAS
ncbi:MAG: nitrous oxide reductase accessory protein NosL [Gemmatimonadales bacterium]